MLARSLHYTNSQVCMLSAMCKNFFKIYTLMPGEDFECELSDPSAQQRLDEVTNLVLDTRPEPRDTPAIYDDDDEGDGDGSDDDWRR